MTEFSIVIITLNEEKKIEQCIDACLKVSSDIVVVDSQSTDRTREIAKRKGARVYNQKWLGYSKAKNFGVDKAINDWIISIDADEVLSEDLIKSINALVAKSGVIYQINILGNFLGKWVKHSGWYPSWKKRIYNRTEFSWDNAEVHEALAGPNKYKLVRLKGDVFHFSYETIQDVNYKTEQYAELLAQEMIKKGKKPSLLKNVFGPSYKFINTYFFKLGFLDGLTGLKISKMNSVVVSKKLKYFKLFMEKSK